MKKPDTADTAKKSKGDEQGSMDQGRASVTNRRVPMYGGPGVTPGNKRVKTTARKSNY